MPVIIVGALGVAVYAAYTIASAIGDSPLLHPIKWAREAGPSSGVGAFLNPFKEKDEDGNWYFRSTAGSYTWAEGDEPLDPSGRLGEEGVLGTATPYMPQGFFESDSHYVARLASRGFTRASYKAARKA